MPTNMDVNKNKTATVPVLEFRLPVSEVDAPLKMGQAGNIVIPVEVVEVSDGMIMFRKIGKAEADDFHEEPLSKMRERIGVVEDEEKPLKEDK